MGDIVLVEVVEDMVQMEAVEDMVQIEVVEDRADQDIVQVEVAKDRKVVQEDKCSAVWKGKLEAQDTTPPWDMEDLDN